MTDRPDMDLVASNIAASVMARRHDFMSWPTEHGEVLDDAKLAQVIEEEVVKELSSAGWAR